MVRGLPARLIGIVLIAGGLLGVCVSLAGIGLLWGMESRINRHVASASQTLRLALDGADDMLAVTGSAIGQAEAQLDDVERTLDGVALSLADTAGTTRAFGELAGGDLADVVANTRTALQTASRTAGIVDDTLAVVTRLPLVGGSYEPRVPLAEGIGRVERSLAPVPGQLRQVDAQLRQAADSIDTIRGNLDRVADRMDGAETSLGTARASVTAYEATVTGLQAKAANLEADFARALRLFNGFATVALLWLLVAQVGLLTQGYEWLRREGVD